MKFDNLIDPHANADGPPPATLFAFLRWAFQGSFKYIALGSVLSVLAGTLEVLTALILGCYRCSVRKPG